MPCPTCSHTMQRVEQLTLWCQRCGTIGTRDDDALSEAEAPMLVKRCRDFEKYLAGFSTQGIVASVYDEFKRLGLTESINTPENRP